LNLPPAEEQVIQYVYPFNLQVTGIMCRVQKGITELHRTLYSAVIFGPGEEVPHLGSGAAHRRDTSITGTSRTAAVGRTSVGSCA